MTDRNLGLTNGGMETFDQALAWLVRAYDREFKEAVGIEIHIGQFVKCDSNGDCDPNTLIWVASISGMLSEDEDDEEDEA